MDVPDGMSTRTVSRKEWNAKTTLAVRHCGLQPKVMTNLAEVLLVRNKDVRPTVDAHRRKSMLTQKIRTRSSVRQARPSLPEFCVDVLFLLIN